MSMAEIYVFDMDHTLIENDCDVSWKEFCVAEKLAPASDIAEADRFYELYLAGKLDFKEFLAFQLREFVGNSAERMNELAQKHFENFVKSKVRPKALDYVKSLVKVQKRCVILTSTNSIIARPVADYFGIDEVYGAELEMVDNVYTGNLSGIYTAGEGKVEVIRKLSAESGVPTLEFAAFGDSINDLPMLKAVGHPFAVSPGAALEKEAKELNFEILDWKL